MRNFNLNSVTKHVRSSGFTVAQEEFFLDCQLEALGKSGPGTGLTPSLENAGAAAILGGLIGGLIGLLWGIYDHFFGKKKALDVTIDKFEFTFSTKGTKEWDDVWTSYTDRTKNSKFKSMNDVIQSLANSQKFRSIVDRNLFTLAIASGQRVLFDLDLLGIVLNDVTRTLISNLSDVNRYNVKVYNDNIFRKMTALSKATSPIESIAKIANVEEDLTDFFTTLDTVNNALTVLKGNTVNVSEAEYTKQAKYIYSLGEHGIDRLEGKQSDTQKDRFKDIGELQRTALSKLEQIKKSVGSAEDDPELVEFRKNAVKALTAVSKFYGNMLQYAALEMKYRTEIVDVLLTELKKAWSE